MKFVAVGIVVLISALAIVSAVTECSFALEENDIPTKWVKMTKTCNEAMEQQIQKEINASFTYLKMAAHFSRDTVNRPGFAEFFFNAAKEEREHGMKLIEYLSMRGKLTTNVAKLFSVPAKTNVKTEWTGIEALTEALNLETEVTESIRDVIYHCEKPEKENDYHLVDYLTGVYLEEQYKGQREIAGKLSTLKKMQKDGESDAKLVLGEFLFDKNL